MALSTDDDRPLDWLRAGEALQHALLTGTRYSMSAPGGRSAGYRRGCSTARWTRTASARAPTSRPGTRSRHLS